MTKEIVSHSQTETRKAETEPWESSIPHPAVSETENTDSHTPSKF